MSDIFFTGPLTRAKADKHHTVFGNIQLLQIDGGAFYAYVYDPTCEDFIWELEGESCYLSTSLNYEVSDIHKTWFVVVLTEGISIVNIYHSVNDEHRPALCWKYPELSLINYGYGYGAVSLSTKMQTKVDAFKAKVAIKKATKLASTIVA